VQEILKKRNEVNDSKNQLTTVTKSKVLLSGLVFCGHCGGRLTPQRYQERYTRKKDGTERKIDQMRYQCYHKSRKLCECDGRATYKAEVIDGAVCEVIRDVFKRVQVMPDKHAIDKNIKQLVQSNAAEQKK